MTPRRKRRAGYTLIQLLVAFSIASLAFAVSAVMIHSLYRVSFDLRMQTGTDLAIDRLTHRLRDDAIVSRDILVEEQPAKSLLTLILSADESISYTSTDDGITRIQRRDGEVIHRDTFRVGSVAATAELQRRFDAPLATLTLTHGDNAATAPIAIVLAPGAAHREEVNR